MRNPSRRLLIVAGAIGTAIVVSLLPAGRPTTFIPWLVASALDQDEQRPPVFRGGTTFVYVDVYPRQDGQVIEGLTKDDFEVTENGRSQAVETFQFIKYDTALIDDERRDPTSLADSERQAADPRNRVFVVYLDPYSIELDAIDVKTAVMTFLERTIGARDLFAAMTPEMNVASLTFARRLETLADDLDEVLQGIRLDGERKDWPRTPVEERLMECVRGDPNAFRALAEFHRQDMLLTNLENLMVRLSGLREERKNILFVSEGWVPIPRGRRVPGGASRPTIPEVGVGPTGRLGIGNQQPYSMDQSWCGQQFARLGAIDFEERLRDVVTRARQSNVSFYPVDVGGLEADRISMTRDGKDVKPIPITQEPSQTLLTLAENTDGLAIVNTNDVVGAVRKLTNSLAGMYLLGYYSTNPSNDGRYRQIRVRLKRPNVEVSSRQGYFAPTAAEVAAAARAAAAPRAAPPTAVDNEIARLARARPDSDVFAHGAAIADQLHVVVELSSREMESGRWRAGAEVRATVDATGPAQSAMTAKIDAGARVATLALPTTGTTGPWKVDLRIIGGGNALDSSLTVTPGVGSLFAEPLLFRANPSPRAPLKAVADFQYRRSERIRVEWRTLKMLTDRQARLLDSKGQPLALAVAVTDRDDANGRTVLADLTLAPLIEGTYVIELTGSAGAERQRALVAFRIVR